jgi:site-specific recombinase XerD
MENEKLKKIFVSSIGSNSDNTQRSYETVLDTFNYDINDMTYESYIEYKNSLSDYSVATQRKYISVTKEFLEWCFVNYDMGSSKELFKIQHVKAPRGNSKETQPLTTKEIKLMLALSKNDRDKAILMLGCITGLRVNEIIELKIEDIKNGYIEVYGKGNKYRMVYPNEDTMDILNTYINGMRAKKVAQKNVSITNVFISNGGEKMLESSINRTLKCISKKAGIDKNVHPHTMRHTCATLMYENGLDIKDIQTALGHANVSTTNRYTHGNVEIMKKKLNGINMLG